VHSLGTECTICLGEFIHGEMVRLLPRCHHHFHVWCIDSWLAEHSSCPICHSSLLKDDHSAGEATGIGDEATYSFHSFFIVVGQINFELTNDNKKKE
jgi:hypothetical protein